MFVILIGRLSVILEIHCMLNVATKKEFHMLLCLTVKIYIRPCVWSLCDLVQRRKIQYLAGLPRFNLYPAGETSRDRKEWGLFLTYLMSRDTVKFIPIIHALLYF